MRLKYNNYVLLFVINVLVRTKSLTNVRLCDDRLYRLNLIKSLSERGLNTVEISDALNIRNIRTPRGVRYSPKLVGVTLKKYLNRLGREKHLVKSEPSETVHIFHNFSDIDD